MTLSSAVMEFWLNLQEEVLGDVPELPDQTVRGQYPSAAAACLRLDVH